MNKELAKRVIKKITHSTVDNLKIIGLCLGVCVILSCAAAGIFFVETSIIWLIFGHTEYIHFVEKYVSAVAIIITILGLLIGYFIAGIVHLVNSFKCVYRECEQELKYENMRKNS